MALPQEPNVIKDDVDKMKHRIKLFLIPFVLLATLFLVTACGNNSTAYDDNDAIGHTVSVKFDANGGVFTGTSTLMVDSFNISNMQKDSSGMVNLKLLDPTDSKRGDWTPANGSKVLAGWYKERTESTDNEGNVIYSYSGKFDFETDVVTVDPSKTYTSAEPVLTLYAVWVEKFSVNFISMETGESLGTYEFNPMGNVTISVPTWNTETGSMDMYKFPAINGKTFEAAYYDAEGTQPVGETVIHGGKIEPSTGVAVDPVMNVYVKYTEGNWYHITNAKQLSAISDTTGHYVIEADLDFSEDGAFWPTSFVHGKFTGSIQGNGHTIKNVTVEQSNINKTETGLFGSLMSGCKISDVTFENITLIISRGARTPGSSFGLLAGNVNPGTELENVKITSGTIQIDADNCFWATDDFSIGLLCGVGSFAADSDLAGIDYSGITCEKVGDMAMTITVEGNTVTIAVG